MSSSVAWLSFDAEQQRRTQLMLSALSTQGTVDELGLGIIRDLIARELHPGLTVLHRRAKYLLLIPRDYQHLPTTSIDRMLTAGKKAEADTAKRLVAYYATQMGDIDSVGIIGRQKGELTQQLPSERYWGLLRRLGILREPGSIYDYCRRRVDAATQHTARKTLHEEGEIVEPESGAWAELPGGDFTGFSLNTEEAEWLRARFLLAEQNRPDNRKSLVYWLLDPSRETWWSDVRFAWNHPEQDSFPAKTAEVMKLGRDLDAFVHSARIAYNYLCAVGRPDESKARTELIEKYETAMKAWQDSPANSISAERLAEIDVWAGSALTDAQATSAARRRWALTSRFLSDWHNVVTGTRDLLADDNAATILKRREVWLKQGRARLGNAELLRGWQGDSSYFHLDYNWPVAMFVCGDIHDGLGTPTRSAGKPA